MEYPTRENYKVRYWRKSFALVSRHTFFVAPANRDTHVPYSKVTSWRPVDQNAAPIRLNSIYFDTSGIIYGKVDEEWAKNHYSEWWKKN